MPFNTDTMFFDEATNQYKLTEQALVRQGIDMRSRLAKTHATSPEYIISALLTNVSDMIYDFIHAYNVHNEAQDTIILSLNSARAIIERAMTKQAIYTLYNGNLNMSVEDNMRNKAISPEAVNILNKTIPEIGASILYMGV